MSLATLDALIEAPFSLRESAASGVTPPHYRQTDSTTEDCSTCFYDDAGACRLYERFPVDAEHVCDTWTPQLRESIATFRGKLRRALRLREGTYEAGTHTVYFQDDDTLRDAAHLYAILKEQADTGSPNLENELVLGFVKQLQAGQLLSGPQLGKLLGLLGQYATEIEAYRADPDDSQDIMAVPDGNTARIIQ